VANGIEFLSCSFARQTKSHKAKPGQRFNKNNISATSRIVNALIDYDLVGFKALWERMVFSK